MTQRKTKVAQAVEAQAQPAEDISFTMTAVPDNFTRVCVAWVVGLAGSVGLSYLGGTIITYALIGATLLGVSFMLQLVITAALMYATFYFGTQFGQFLRMSVQDKVVDGWYVACRDRVTGLFSRATVGATS